MPKQLVPLINGENLFSLTIQRLLKFSNRFLLVSSEEHRFLLCKALERLDTTADIILEPFAKNTAAAIAMATVWANEHKGADALLLICPADHIIPDKEAFYKTISQGIDSALKGKIITFGISPTEPSSAFGYIHAPNLRNQYTQLNETSQQNYSISSVVKGFVEKPNAMDAQKFVLSGEYVWNAGIFLATTSTLLKAFEFYAKDILGLCQKAMFEAGSEEFKFPQIMNPQDENNSNLVLNKPTSTSHPKLFNLFIRPNKEFLKNCRSTSIDYAVMEVHPDLEVVPLNTQWSDVGNWNAISNLFANDQNGNHLQANSVALNTKNTFIYSSEPSKRTIAALGLNDLIIVDTPDALLVAEKKSSEQVKDLVSHMIKGGNSHIYLHRKVFRPWGWYDSIDQSHGYLVKRINVSPGATLSLQRHKFRAEHWIVVKGRAEVICGENKFILEQNQSTFIPMGSIHRLSNPCKDELEIIEIQTGTLISEEDIERLDDDFGRTSSS